MNDHNTGVTDDEPMIDAKQAAASLSLPYYWFADQTMRSKYRIPHYLLGGLGGHAAEFRRHFQLGFNFLADFGFFIQFFGYSSELWKGKKFETVIHVLFVFIWTYLSVVFLLASWKH